MFPIRKVVVYKNGIAYFERAGTVQGNQDIQLEFKAFEVNEVLRSLRIIDEDGGSVSNVSYDTAITNVRKSKLVIPTFNSMATVYSAMQGARVKIQKETKEPEKEGETKGEDELVGRVIGVTTKAETKNTPQTHELDLLVGNQITSVNIQTIKSISILDENLPKELEDSLDEVMEARNTKGLRSVTVRCTGEGKRSIRVSYMLPHLVWKSSYRININSTVQPQGNSSNNNSKYGLKDEVEFEVEGWACVDNISQENWQDISLSLTSGTPINYAYDLYNPIIVEPQPTYSLGFTHSVVSNEANYKQGHSAHLANGVATPFSGGNRPANAPNAAQAPAQAPQQVQQGATFGGAPAPNNIENNNYFANIQATRGSSFQYEAPGKISVSAQSSALVPVVKGKVTGKQVCWYKPKTHFNPFVSVLFKNTLGATLDKGPVVVTSDNSFVGEGMLDTFVLPGEWKIVPFYANLSCVVTALQTVQEWVPETLSVSRGRLSGTQRLQETCGYRIKNHSDTVVNFALDHTIPEGWDYVGANANQDVKLDEKTRRLFVTIPPRENFKLEMKHYREERTADIWILNFTSTILEQLESSLTPVIGDTIVEFFESAKTIYGLRSTYTSLLQQEEGILAEQHRLYSLVSLYQHDANVRTTMGTKLMDLEEKLTRVRDSRDAAFDKWQAHRAGLLESIEKMEFKVDLEADKPGIHNRFKVPPLLPTMSIRELIAEPPAPAQESLFRTNEAKPQAQRLGDGVAQARQEQKPSFSFDPAAGFGAATTTPAPTPPLFGTTTTAPSVFPSFGTPAAATTTPAFGATTTPAFGATTPAFGATTSTAPAFGTAPSSTSTPTFSVFGTSASTSPAPSPFGASSSPSTDHGTSTAPANPFGATTTVFGTASSTPSTPSVFGVDTSSAATSASQQSNSNSVWSAPVQRKKAM